jgi:hypothetical protein
MDPSLDGDGATAPREHFRRANPEAAVPIAGELYVALHDGTIKVSTDGGVNWGDSIRSIGIRLAVLLRGGVPRPGWHEACFVLR